MKMVNKPKFIMPVAVQKLDTSIPLREFIDPEDLDTVIRIKTNLNISYEDLIGVTTALAILAILQPDKYPSERLENPDFEMRKIIQAMRLLPDKEKAELIDECHKIAKAFEAYNEKLRRYREVMNNVAF